MNRLSLLLFTVILCASCGQAPADNNKNNNKAANILEVTEPCAVLYTPAGAKLQSLKSAFGEKNFRSIMKFNQVTMVADSLFLAGKKVKIISTSLSQIRFVKKNGEDLSLNLNHAKFAWEIFLFNGFSDPVKADLTDIESSYREAGLE